VPGDLLRTCSRILHPEIDPSRELEAKCRYAIQSRSGRGHYTYRVMPRRSPPGGFRLPGQVRIAPNVLVIVDTSGSMSDDDLGLCLGAIDRVLRRFPGPVKVIAGDTHAAAVGKYASAASVRLVGGGGTDMAHIIGHAAGDRPRPDVILVCTDGHTEWPAADVGIKVVAALTRRERAAQVPSWIETVIMQQ
jgi:predicted metal-dependent peptidase